MALFESYERREKQILAVLKEYGINSIEEAGEITKAVKCSFLSKLLLKVSLAEIPYSCVSFKTSSGLSDPNPARPPPQRQSAGEP